MAGRIRSIKPEILDDEKTAALSHLEWRLFVSLWLIADDYGNLRGDAGYVMGQTLWSTGESRENVAKALETLATVSLLSGYSVRGQTYYHITGWSKHQKVDKPGKPRMPGPNDTDSVSIRTPATDSREPRDGLAESSRESRESLAPDLRPPTNDPDQDPELGAPRFGAAQPDAPRHEPQSKRKKRRSRIPEDWQPAAAERQQAIAAGVDCDALARRFKRHYTASGAVFLNWNEKFAGWIENENGRMRNGHPPPKKTLFEHAMDALADAEARERAGKES
jgi:hypothetical protein